VRQRRTHPEGWRIGLGYRTWLEQMKKNKTPKAGAFGVKPDIVAASVIVNA
jgi:hypothetical protein